MAGYRVISSDSHVVEPPDLWTTRTEPEYRDRAPYVVAKEDGDWWYCEGERIIGQHNGTATGIRFEEGEDLVSQNSLWEDVRPGGYIPEEHVKDMDADGVDAGLIYPSVGLALFRSVRDSRLLAALFRTYNDWLAEFCLVSPGRLRGIAMIDIDDIGSGVNEMERCARSGLAGAMVSVYPVEDRAYHLPDYGRLWAAAEDLDMPLSLHLATNRPGPSQTFWGPSAQPHAFLCNADHWPRMSLFHMIFSGVFERHPKLRVGVIETELSWVPHFLKQLDYNYTQRAHGQDAYRFRETALPSDYFHRNVFLSFQEDDLGVRLRDLIGVDNLLWGSDYPHAEGTFPRSRQIIEEILADCTEEEKAKICGGNAARVYRL